MSTESQGFGGTAKHGLHLCRLEGALRAYSVGFGALRPELVRVTECLIAERPISRALIRDTIVRNLCLRVKFDFEEIIHILADKLIEFLKKNHVKPTYKLLDQLIEAILTNVEDLSIVGRIYGSVDGNCKFVGTDLCVELDFKFLECCLEGHNSTSSFFLPECGHLALLLEFGELEFKPCLFKVLVEIFEKIKSCSARKLAKKLQCLLCVFLGEALRPTVSAGVELDPIIVTADTASVLPSIEHGELEDRDALRDLIQKLVVKKELAEDG